MGKDNFLIFDSSVDVNEAKKLVNIWDYQLSSILEDHIEEKTGVVINIWCDWEDSNHYFVPSNAEALSKEDKEKLIQAFGFDEDFFDHMGAYSSNFNKEIYKLLFGDPNTIVYNGSSGGRGEQEFVFNLDNAEYEFFMKLAARVIKEDDL